MKKFFFILFIAAGIFLSPDVFASEKIDNFDVTIKINSDASINVSENIEYNFGDLQRHGIYRDIPVKYKARGGNFNLRISDISVTDENGASHNFTTSQQGSNFQIKIGDADKLVTGKKNYVINYVIKRAINYFDSYDELYWNATGDKWQVPVEKSSAKVILPEGVNTNDAMAKCYYGSYGSTLECPAEIKGEDSVKVIVYNHPEELAPYQGLTIVAGFPKGIVRQPTFIENFLETLKDNWILFLPLAVFAILFYTWYTHGRDPQGRGTVVAQYEAPDDLTPVEIGTIIDEKFGNKDISAEIVSLAVNGYLKIRRVEEKRVFFKSKDYYLDKLKEGNDLKDDFDRKLMEGLFDGKQNVKLSSLKNKFYKDLAEIKKQVYKDVVDKGYFPKNPATVRVLYLLSGIGLFFISFFLGAVWGALGVISLVISGIIIIIFSFFMPRKTKKGAEAKEHILGLKEYLSVAEKDRIKFHNAPAAIETLAGKPDKTPDLFEKMLPFAMVLGVEKEWAKQFEGIYNQPPEWYEDSTGASFNSLYLANSLSNFSQTASASLASSPSSASGGGSGFSGGGGGGGFGGGGGGSW